MTFLSIITIVLHNIILHFHGDEITLPLARWLHYHLAVFLLISASWHAWIVYYWYNYLCTNCCEVHTGLYIYIYNHARHIYTIYIYIYIYISLYMAIYIYIPYSIYDYIPFGSIYIWYPLVWYMISYMIWYIYIYLQAYSSVLYRIYIYIYIYIIIYIYIYI